MSARIFRAEEPKLAVVAGAVLACLLPILDVLERFGEKSVGGPTDGGM